MADIDNIISQQRAVILYNDFLNLTALYGLHNDVRQFGIVSVLMHCRKWESWPVMEPLTWQKNHLHRLRVSKSSLLIM